MEDVIKMPRKTFDIYETESILAGGAVAGQYLDSLKETDLAKLGTEQFLLFFTKFAGAYEDHMRKVFMGEK